MPARRRLFHAGQAQVQRRVDAWRPLDGLTRRLNVGEPLGQFLAPVAGQRRLQTWANTVAHIGRLVIHRHAMLGVFDEHGLRRRGRAAQGPPLEDAPQPRRQPV